MSLDNILKEFVGLIMDKSQQEIENIEKSSKHKEQMIHSLPQHRLSSLHHAFLLSLCNLAWIKSHIHVFISVII